MFRHLDRTAAVALTVACIAGAIHAAVTLHWAVGGTAWIETIGDMADRFDGRESLLIAFAAAKGAGTAIIAWGILRPGRRSMRAAAWFTATVLVTWGGLNTVTATFLLVDVIPRPADLDVASALGHAALWDPLFLAWGLAGAIGLWATRRSPHIDDRTRGACRAGRQRARLESVPPVGLEPTTQGF